MAECSRRAGERMRRGVRLVVVGALALAGFCTWGEPARANQFVRMDFSLSLNDRWRSTAFIELFDDKPLTRDNFMLYVNGGLYDGMLMHRLARNFVLQGGGFYPNIIAGPPTSPVSDPLLNVALDPFDVVDLDGNLGTPNPGVVNEYSVGTIRSNIKGTISMARQGGLPNSADSEWFVNYGNNSGLDSVDGGFNVFAQVLNDGMVLLDAYNGGLSISNLNPDLNNNVERDPGPFGSYNRHPTTGAITSINTGDGVPYANSLLLLSNADRVDYYGPGSTTNIPVGGLTISARDAYFDTGAAFTGTGALTIGAGRSLGVREGMSLTRAVNNLGKLEPGLDLGAISVQSYQQAATGTLAIDLRGTTVDTQYDRLTVTGAASLAGTLTIDLQGGYTPKTIDSFIVLASTNLSGTFAGVANGARLFVTGGVGSLAVNYDYALDRVTLASFAFAGDFNRDGTVGAADLTAWRNAMTLGNAGADADGDGDSDGNDLLIWQRQLGRSTPTSAAAVPEPAAGMLAMMFAVALRRRRDRTLKPQRGESS